MYGAALAFVLAKIIIVFIVVHLSKLHDDVGYRITKMLRIIGPSLLFMIAGLYFSYTKYLTVFSFNNFIYKILVLLAYVLFVYITNKAIIEKALKSGRIFKMLKRVKSK